MDLERDKYFFHYTTAEAAFEKILPGERLRFSRYADMRDPLENHGWLIAAGGYGEADEETQRRQTTGVLTFNWLANQVHKRARLLSLTVDAPTDSELTAPFDRGWARARMWEQYAENHQGVCLVFDKRGLTLAVELSMRQMELPPPRQGFVNYSGEGRLKPLISMDREDDEDATAAEVQSYIDRNYETLFLEKTLDWETEYEYRFSTIAGPSDDSPVSVEIRDSLHAVIVGERFPAWQRPGAIAACGEVGAIAARVAWDWGAPRLADLKPRWGRRGEIREHVQGRPGPPSR